MRPPNICCIRVVSCSPASTCFSPPRPSRQMDCIDATRTLKRERERNEEREMKNWIPLCCFMGGRGRQTEADGDESPQELVGVFLGSAADPAAEAPHVGQQPAGGERPPALAQHRDVQLELAHEAPIPRRACHRTEEETEAITSQRPPKQRPGAASRHLRSHKRNNGGDLSEEGYSFSNASSGAGRSGEASCWSGTAGRH